VTTSSKAPETDASTQDQQNVARPDYQILKEKQRDEGLSISEEAIIQAIEQIKKDLKGIPKEFEYEIKGNDIIVRIMNKETHELIKEIPPEKMIDLVKKLRELVSGASGTFIDAKR